MAASVSGLANLGGIPLSRLYASLTLHRRGSDGLEKSSRMVCKHAFVYFRRPRYGLGRAAHLPVSCIAKAPRCRPSSGGTESRLDERTGVFRPTSGPGRQAQTVSQSCENIFLCGTSPMIRQWSAIGSGVGLQIAHNALIERLGLLRLTFGCVRRDRRCQADGGHLRQLAFPAEDRSPIRKGVHVPLTGNE